MPQFTIRPQQFPAVQWNETQADYDAIVALTPVSGVSQWPVSEGPTLAPTTDPLYLLSGYERLAQAGQQIYPTDWVVLEDGRLVVYTDGSFQTKYQPAGGGA